MNTTMLKVKTADRLLETSNPDTLQTDLEALATGLEPRELNQVYWAVKEYWHRATIHSLSRTAYYWCITHELGKDAEDYYG